MAAKHKSQATISRFFTSKSKTNTFKTDSASPPKKKCKVAEVDFSPPLKRQNSLCSDTDEEKSPKVQCNRQVSTQSNGTTNSCESSSSPTKRSKLDSFRFKGSVNKEEVSDGSPRKKSFETRSKGFTVPKGVKLTPLESQVVAIKEKYCDAILFVECGYKFRFFGEDAEIAAKELNIIAHLDHNFQTASIPTHRLHVHVRRLVAKGYKVGVVKQTETAALKAIGSNKTAPFTRELSALYTKATLIGEDVDPVGGDFSEVAETATSALMVLMETKSSTGKEDKTGIVLVSLQPSTGDVVYDSFDDSAARFALWGRLERIHPVEVIVKEDVSHVTRRAIKALMTRHDDCIRIENLPEEVFEYSSRLQNLCNLYECNEPKIRQLTELPHGVISCLGAALHYLKEFKLERILKNSCNISQLSSANDYMNLPGPTLRNLEVIVNSSDRSEKGSLFWILNHTRTKFGARVLRQWLLHPLLNVERIVERQEMIQELMSSDAPPITTLKKLLPKLPDFEKSITTIFYKKCSPFEFWTTVSGLGKVQRSLDSVSACGNLSEVIETPPLAHLINTIIDKLSNIHQYSDNIDETSAKENKKTSLFKNWSEFSDVVECQEEIEAVEKQLDDLKGKIARTLGFPSFSYTTVSGLEYLIEVKNKNLMTVPDSWIKVNSTKMCCRFRSREVDKYFTKLQQLREQLKASCHEAWMQVVDKFSDHYQDYREAVKCIGSLDALFSLAKVAQLNGYCKPHISDGDESCIHIQGGKHPIVHQLRGDDLFVANDTNMTSSEERVMLVTGPNMGGKSCYMRQVALIVLMAQTGSYVPAESATLSVLDGIYTRMGATDEIFSGKSSLMVEIGETADIMQQATKKSLVILDELGRGTSTHDGVAIATATLDFFLKKIQCLTIFVTHYLTLCEFGERYPENVGKHHMAFIVNEECEDDDVEVITFLYQLTTGNAGQSYGLNVARLANLPQSVLKKASHMSKELRLRTKRKKSAKEKFKKVFGSSSTITKEDLCSIKSSDV